MSPVASTNINSQANGSAIVEAADLKVVCAVYGPRQLTSKHPLSGPTAAAAAPSTLNPSTPSTPSNQSQAALLQCDFKFAPFAGPGGVAAPRRPFARTVQERAFARVLEQALAPSIRLNLYPKSAIQIFVIVLEADGASASLAAAISCAALALANAGIELLDIVTACVAGLANSIICLDPTHLEEQFLSANILLAYMPSLNVVSHIIQSGEISPAQCTKAVELCVDACSQILTVTQDTLLAG